MTTRFTEPGSHFGRRKLTLVDRQLIHIKSNVRWAIIFAHRKNPVKISGYKLNISKVLGSI
jgi:hypothetical protein